MPIYTDVVASRIEKYRAQLERENGNDADIDTAILKYVICQLVDAAFGGGGGGGGGSTSATTIAQGINQSTDIDAIVTKLTSIDANQVNQSSIKAAIETATNLTSIVNKLTAIDVKLIQESDIVSAIQSATDIDTLISNLVAIANNTYPVGARTIAQSQSVSIASDQQVPINTQQIKGVAIATGLGTASSGTQRVVLSIDSKISGYGYESKATINRPANTTPYAANTVYGGVFELTDFGAVNEHVILSGVRVIFSNTILPAGMAGFTLFLYSNTPPSAIVDGGVFGVPASDRSTLLTPKGIDLENAETALGGGSVVLQVDNKNIQLKLAAGSSSVWGYLVTRAAHTPVSGSTAVISTLALGV